MVAKVIEYADKYTLNNFVQQTVSSKVSLVATDESSGYGNLKKGGFPHETITHSKNEYVRGNVHTSNIDSFWSLIKRGMMGTFHNVSKDYLPLYVNEFSYRHNNRNNPDTFADLITMCSH